MATSTNVPHDPLPDSTFAFLREGYDFIGNRARRFGSPVFTTRLMGRRAWCITGADAAAFFYDGDRFTRAGAMPPTTLRLLQDLGSVQSLDGAAHRHRKHLFMAMMPPDRICALADAFEAAWREALAANPGGDIVLNDALVPVLARAACDWVGLPAREPATYARMGRELRAMIEQAGAVSPKVLHALLLRRRSERSARGIVRRARRGDLAVEDGSPLRAIVDHRDEQGDPLPDDVAAIELLNLLRPIVAVKQYLVFAALAFHEHPEQRDWVLADLPNRVHPFAVEIRRFYLFFPLIGGRAKDDLEWNGVRFPRGAWVLLDLHGTNHDPAVWEEPERFRPQRFVGWPGDPYTVVPQGAGDPYTGHRCPGEWLTEALIERWAAMLGAQMRYEVPPQDLSVSRSSFPAVPASGFCIAGASLLT